MENKSKHIKLVIRKQEGIIWYQNQTIIQQFFFPEKLLAIEIKKTNILELTSLFRSINIKVN